MIGTGMGHRRSRAVRAESIHRYHFAGEKKHKDPKNIARKFEMKRSPLFPSLSLSLLLTSLTQRSMRSRSNFPDSSNCQFPGLRPSPSSLLKSDVEQYPTDAEVIPSILTVAQSCLSIDATVSSFHCRFRSQSTTDKEFWSISRECTFPSQCLLQELRKGARD